MLTIRFARVGRKKKSLYRVVVSEKTKDTYGDYLENLGTYDPHTKKAELKVERIKHWLDNGAQTSDVVHNLLLKEKLIEGKKAKAVAISKKRTARMKKAKDGDKKEEKKKEAPKEEEKPVEEKKKEAPKEEAKSEEKKEETKPEIDKK